MLSIRWKYALVTLALGCGSDAAIVTSSEQQVDLGGLESKLLAAALPTTDSISDYAEKCDLATGIHVPDLNCLGGVDIPQGLTQVEGPNDEPGLTSTGIGNGSGGRTEILAQEIIGASGGNIGGTSDSLYFSYATYGATGFDKESDGVAETQLLSMQNAGANAMAGLMFRKSTAANSTNVFLGLKGSNVVLQQRSTAGGNTTVVATVTGRSLPLWLRLTRTGSSFAATISSDRVTWSSVGTATISSFEASPVAGLAVTSNATAQVTATFDRNSWMSLSVQPFHLCDTPNALFGECDPGSRFKVLAQSPDATVVANCRKSGLPGVNEFGDVAVIQYNKQNGAVCFYQAYGVTQANAVKAPISGDAVWEPPSEAHGGASRCTGCHDNGAFIRSPYLTQLNAVTNASPLDRLPTSDSKAWKNYNNLTTPLRYVGLDFAGDRSWSVSVANDPADSGQACNSCHRLAINNISRPESGSTAGMFAGMSTKPSFSFAHASYNYVGPSWMRPHTNVFADWDADPDAAATAERYYQCSAKLWNNGFPSHSNNFSLVAPAGYTCNYSPLGKAWTSLAGGPGNFSPSLIGGATGQLNGSVYPYTFSAAGAGIAGASDKLFFAARTPSAQAFTGDGAVTVKLVSQDNTAAPQAGIMFRNGLGVGAETLALSYKKGTGAILQYRTASGTNVTTSPAVAATTLPRWLRVVRTGNSFTGWISANLATWTQVGPAVEVPVLATSSALVGLAVASNSTAATQTTGSFQQFEWTPASALTLADANIGITGGSRSEFGITETISAKGRDIWDASDEFFFSYKSFSGDGSIIARVPTLSPAPDGWTKAGLMFRATVDGGSVHAMMALTRDNGVTFQARTTVNVIPTKTNVASTHRWLKLTRTGNVFKGYSSANGTTWTQVGSSTTIAGFPTKALVGLAVTSHNTGSSATATFDDVVLP